MRLAISIRLLIAVTAVLALTSVLPAVTSAQVSIGISVGYAPPELPVYEQPICPGEGYIWTPGYWAWDPDDEDYYWVPGTWVLAPEVGFLWTPGYWGWGGTAFLFHEGYWGPVVGFYGGINYGYGYLGRGYEGGRWDGGRFYYNRAVNNINVTVIHNVYNTRVVNNFNSPRVSYNGGNGGVNARPTAQEEAAARQRHIGPAAPQIQHIQAARSNRELRASENHGKPPIAATQRPGAFSGGAVVPASKGGKYNPPPNRGANSRAANNQPSNANRPENGANRAANSHSNYVHPNDLPKPNRSDRPPNTGNPKTDQKYQQQQQKLYQRQDQERQKLQQKQDQEHQRVTQQRADNARAQQMEQRHQQQTQQMQQRHEQQQQRMEQRQPPPSHQSERKPPK